MTRFKPKTKKPIAFCDKKITTIDKTHKERLYMFKDDDNIIEKLKKEKEIIKKKLQLNNMSLEDQLDEKDRLNVIKKQIKTTQQKKKNYLLNNSNFIFEYFEEKKI